MENKKTTQEKKDKGETAFASQGEFMRKLKAYFKFCQDPPRLPNRAGFCRFCGITREALQRAKEVYPLAFDLMESGFLDEALNHKVINPAATMAFFYGQLEEDHSAEVRILCDHDGTADGV